jgi:hypothetical protein
LKATGIVFAVVAHAFSFGNLGAHDDKQPPHRRTDLHRDERTRPVSCIYLQDERFVRRGKEVFEEFCQPRETFGKRRSVSLSLENLRGGSSLR